MVWAGEASQRQLEGLCGEKGMFDLAGASGAVSRRGQRAQQGQRPGGSCTFLRLGEYGELA